VTRSQGRLSTAPGCPARVRRVEVRVRTPLDTQTIRGTPERRDIGGAARKLDQSAARKVIHRKDVHSTLFALSGVVLVRGWAV
jgi:hypothetical protein